MGILLGRVINRERPCFEYTAGKIPMKSHVATIGARDRVYATALSSIAARVHGLVVRHGAEREHNYEVYLRTAISVERTVGESLT